MGASVSTILKSLCDLLGFTDIEECSTIKEPMGRINDVLILANRNYVPIDFIVLDIDCNPSCPIILGRPFLRTIGAIIDMKEGNIRFQLPLKKGWSTFQERKSNYLMNLSCELLMNQVPKMALLRSIFAFMPS